MGLRTLQQYKLGTFANTVIRKITLAFSPPHIWNSIPRFEIRYKAIIS